MKSYPFDDALKILAMFQKDSALAQWYGRSARRMQEDTGRHPPVVTMRHKAISSLRASATIMVLRAPLRPPSVRARFLYTITILRRAGYFM